MSKTDDKARFDAAVQAEVAKQMAELHKHFSKTMEMAMKENLKGLDGANAALQKQQKALEKQTAAAERATKKAEREGEKIAEAYFQKSREALKEHAQRELLRNLTRGHLEAGRAVEDICLWLGVKRDFVQRIIDLIDRLVEYKREEAARQIIKLPYNPRLQYIDQGRGGTIIFENDLGKFEMWWEFAGGDALAIIDIPAQLHWLGRTKLPEEQRDDILNFIGQQVVLDQTSGSGSYEIGDSLITIFR